MRRRTTRVAFVVAAGAVVWAAAACGSATAPRSTVRFVLDAPFCSMTIPIAFRVDGAVIATDTFRIHLPPDHTTHTITLAAGTHTIGARAIPNGYVWSEKLVTLAPGAAVDDTLGLYCS